VGGNPIKAEPRDDFSQSTKRALAQRVGYLCSNPACRAHTTGPRADPAKSINLGVAAHITAAAGGGPRFDSELIDGKRKNAVNGIWLCQNCAKLIDNDPDLYTSAMLFRWKNDAEEEAKLRVGKNNSKSKSRSERDAISQLRREHKLRNELHRDLLKTPVERMQIPVTSSRVQKFEHGEVIVHRIGDKTYPDVDKRPGISGWFKLEMFDFYHGGVECILALEHALVDRETGDGQPSYMIK